MKIDGKIIAQKIIEDLKKEKRPSKSLAVVLVGNGSESLSFVKQKEKIANDLGIKFNLFQLNKGASESEAINKIKELNKNNKIGGIVLQLPLPPHINRDKIIAAIDFKKDVDALNPENKLVFAPSAEVVKDILKTTDYKLKTKIVAVVGSKGFLVGKPIVKWLKGKCKKIIALDIGDDLSQIKEADLVITGVGKAGLIRPEMLKNDAGVIDFGYSLIGGKLKGDFYPVRSRPAEGGATGTLGRPVSNGANPDSLVTSGYSLNTISYTPTPGGTGPILVAEIYKNFYKLNK